MSEKAVLQAENYTVTEKNSSEGEVSEQQSQSNGLKIEGMAMPFEKRSRNGVKYDTDSIKSNAESMIGNSILFNHDEHQPIGHVTDVELKDDGLYYEGDINPERKESESLKRGDIPHVSIQAMVEEMEDTDKTGKVAVSEFLELSAVTVPGFPQTDVQTGEAVAIESLVGENKDSEEESGTEKEGNKQVSKEAFEFSPIPDHVLYQSKQEALLRAKRLGLQDVHRHTLDGEDTDFYMAGATHEEWSQAIQDNIENKENTEDRDRSAEPFAGYDDFDDCVNQNSDKNDPEAYCAAIKRKVETSKELSEAVADVDTTPTDEMAEVATNVLEKIEDTELDNDECGTRTGLERANQLENKEELSADTVNRMVSFFARHDGNQEVGDDVDNKWEDCGYVAWHLWGGDPGREWAERKQKEIEDAKEKILGEKSNMKDKTKERIREALEEVAEDDFTGTIADMYEELSASDAASLMEEFTFTGNPEPLVAQLADAAEMSPADLMEMLDEVSGETDDEEDDEAHDDMDDDEEDENEESEASNKNEGKQEESQSGNNSMSKSREELKEKIDDQEERIEELESMIEKLEDTEGSKQATGASTESSEIGLNPEFEQKMEEF